MSITAGIFAIIAVLFFAFWVVTDPDSQKGFPKRPFKKKSK